MKAIASSSIPKFKKRLKPKDAFDVQVFLESAGVARSVVQYRKSERVYAQGDAAASVMYIQNGGIKITVVNQVGKEAVVAMLGPGDFFGEGCLAGQQIRMGTATAIMPTAILVIEKKEMTRVLHAEHELSDRFMAYVLSRNIRIEEDLIDQLFNSSEKRTGSDAFAARPHMAGTPPGTDAPESVSGDAGGNDRQRRGRG